VSFFAGAHGIWNFVAMNVASSITHPHGAASSLGSSTHWFAIGLLIGVLLMWVGPPLVQGLVILFDLVALGWSSVILGYADSARGRWVLIGTAFLFLGMFIGVVRGLRHLGDAEYVARLGNIRRLGRYF
jgi:hypothetical protein